MDYMGRLDSGRDLTRSKYIIVASTAAVAMVLGAMSVGAKLRPDSPATPGGSETLSQIYPIPVKNAGDNAVLTPSNISKSAKLTQQQTIPLAKHTDWSKQVLRTDPVNLQVRVGLTKVAVQVNTLGATVDIPEVVNDTANTAAGVVDAITNPLTSSSPEPNTADNPPAGTSEPSLPPDDGTDADPSNPDEQSSVLNVSIDPELVPAP
jgi:hypothetical protein